jgi:glutamate/tyrosine decarboxylase-like PLP-dependent enzyme
MPDDDVLRCAAELAVDYLRQLPQRHVGARASLADLRRSIGSPLSEDGEAPVEVIRDLARRADPGLVGSAGPRFFGFVIGGALPVSVAADWLSSAWDQNAAFYSLSPANAVVEETVGGWLREIFGLPAGVSFGFVTGCQMANFTALAAARHHLLARSGWDVEARGLFGAPDLRVVVSAEAHVTIFAALRLLGLGAARVTLVPTDEQGRVRPDTLGEALAKGSAPTLVCAQAGNVNTGAFDPLEEIANLTKAHDAWLHVDGAFGLWAAASPATRPLLRGLERADSWASDAHKWLNVPYDSGLVFCAHPESHRAAMTSAAAYLVQSTGPERDPSDWVPESSRRARAFPLYAALRALGTGGVRRMVERACALARHMARRLGAVPGVAILNDVVLNQVLVRLAPPGATSDAPEADAFTRDVVAKVQRDGTCWLGATRWRERSALRISVSNWSTTEADADRSVDAILRAAGR